MRAKLSTAVGVPGYPGCRRVAPRGRQPGLSAAPARTDRNAVRPRFHLASDPKVIELSAVALGCVAFGSVVDALARVVVRERRRHLGRDLAHDLDELGGQLVAAARVRAALAQHHRGLPV
jgi:hypothetical protein